MAHTMIYRELNDGNRIPQIGLGTMNLGNTKTYEVVSEALKLGYREFDTAHHYNNEAGVGRAIRESGIPREEIFVTDKLWITDYVGTDPEKSIDRMLKRLGLDYIDLLLIHIPIGNTLKAWRAMEAAKKAGKVKSIGLSSFYDERLDEIMQNAEIKPAVMQMEIHPKLQQKEMRAFCNKHGIVMQAFYPLGHADPDLIGNPLFAEIGKKYGRNSGEVILRWHIQEGTQIFPGYSVPEFLESNLNVLDFELSDEDMEKIRAFDQNLSYYPTRGIPDDEMWVALADEIHLCLPDDQAMIFDEESEKKSTYVYDPAKDEHNTNKFEE